MPFFECKVSHTLFADDLNTRRVTDNVYVEAKDELEAKGKAVHPRNWLRSAGTFGINKSSSFLIAVGECSRVAKDEVKALRLVEAAVACALSHECP